MALSTWAPGRIAVDPRYPAEGYPAAMPECWAPEGVARQLQAAAETLPPGWQLVVFDAWRPLAVQQQLFDRYKAELRGAHPEASEQALEQAAQRYVALPSADPARPSPHATGGAVDLSLRDETGALLDMGTPFDAFDERSRTRYFVKRLEGDGALARREATCLENRRLLFHTLARAGFTNYPEEWWHVDLGNQFWGRIKCVAAIYGLVALEDGG